MSKPSVAFFGATGGCVIAALVPALQAGYTCSALVRTPTKLVKLLEDRGVSQDVQDRYLTIHEGNVRDTAAVKKALQKGTGNEVHPIIIFGVGGKPVMRMHWKFVTIDDANVTEEGMRAVREALSQIKPSSLPGVLAISTTGLSGEHDIPWSIAPLYHFFLDVPHEDKRKLETSVQTALEDGLISSSTIIRPSLLTDGKSDYRSVYAGYLDRKTSGPDDRWSKVDGHAVGYYISRADVGKFIFEEIIAGGATSEFVGKTVSLTY